MLQRLIEMFAGKIVRISYTNSARVIEGACKTVHSVRNHDNIFDIELESIRPNFAFVPEIITDQSVEGEHRSLIGGRVKVEVVS